MDYEAVRQGLEQAIPFNRHVGLDVAEVGDGRGVIRLPDDERLHNHVGSQHAGALFSAGEAASGAAFVGAFAERMGEITPLARTAEISYLKLARGAITATGTLGEGKSDLLGRLDADGKVEFPVQVEMTDAEGNTVAAMTVHWHVRKNA
jgi:acyl-coenzyme A thioesterase PaaI-like protein